MQQAVAPGKTQGSGAELHVDFLRPSQAGVPAYTHDGMDVPGPQEACQRTFLTASSAAGSTCFPRISTPSTSKQNAGGPRGSKALLPGPAAACEHDDEDVAMAL